MNMEAMNDGSISRQVLERAGCPIHYWLAGPQDRPLVIFTHGSLVDHHMFDPQVPVIAQQYNVLTWDVRGHGLSQPIGEIFSIREAAEDLIAILDRLGYGQATFVGQSLGGIITQELVFLHPERVTALVVIGGVCNTLKLSAFEKLALQASPMLLRLLPDSVRKRQSAHSFAVKPKVQTYLYEASRQIPEKNVITVWTETICCLRYEPDYRITHPLLLTHGKHDILEKFKKAMPTWAARDPHCHYVVIPDAGHCANQDNPEFFNRVLLDFLHEHAP